jgi:hypothetical protein
MNDTNSILPHVGFFVIDTDENTIIAQSSHKERAVGFADKLNSKAVANGGDNYAVLATREQIVANENGDYDDLVWKADDLDLQASDTAPEARSSSVSSYAILSDGETFEGLQGTIVLEVNDEDLTEEAVDGLNNGYPQEAYGEVENGDAKGRVLDVQQLVKLHDEIANIAGDGHDLPSSILDLLQK